MRLFILVITIISALNCSAQDCKELLIRHRKKSEQIQKPVKGTAYHVVMSTTFKLDEAYGQQDFTGKAEVLVTPDYYSYESDLFSCYQDDKNSFVVVHPDQSIYWYKGKTKEFEQLTRQNMLSFQDSILMYSKATGCLDKKLNGKKHTAVRLELDKTLALSSPVEDIFYYFESGSQNLTRIEINYSEGYKMKQQIVNYDLVDLNYQASPFLEAFRSIFQKNGRMVDRYTNYELLDQRNEN